MALRGKTSTTWKPRLIDSYSTAATALQVIATNLQNKVCDDNCNAVDLKSFRRRSINGILAFSTTFCPIKTDLSGNIFWPQASDFPKTRQNGPFLAFLINFYPLKM